MVTQRESVGFTLIELLVVISIIGILASTVAAAMSSARLQAQYTAAIQEMKLVENSLYLVGNGGEALRIVTGNSCMRCTNCPDTTDLRNIASSHPCYYNFEYPLALFVSQSAALKVSDDLIRDPWGSPYRLDENETEGGMTNCTQDTLSTVGPDGLINTSDDYIILLPLRTDGCKN